jgi:hypothetical protein
MIVSYDTVTLNAIKAILDEGDTAIQTKELTASIASPNQNALILADDATVASKILDYLVSTTDHEIITFESPTYSTGDVDTQDFWAKTALHTAGSLDVNATNPIIGSQDLKYNRPASGTTHYRRPVVSSGGGAYTSKWSFKNSTNLGTANSVFVAMANSADTDGARAWACTIKGNGDVVFTDNSGDTTFTGIAPTGRTILYIVHVSSTGVITFIADGSVRLSGTVVSGNQTIDRWLAGGVSSTAGSTDAGRFDGMLYTVPTGVTRKKSILVTPQTTPMELNQTSVLNIQLRQSNLSNDNVVKTVTIHSSSGIVVPSSVDTNGSGFSNEAVFKPTKDATGTIGIFASTDEHVQLPSDGVVGITGTTPDAASEQEWLEVEDVKNDPATIEQRSLKADIRKPGMQNFFFIQKARLVQSFSSGLYSRINSIVVDDMGFIYVNGFATVAENDPTLKQIDKNTGVVSATQAYLANNQNLASRRDGICYDGTSIWVAAAHHLYQFDALSMAAPTDYTPDSAADGDFQFMAFDGEFLWSQLRGGTHAHKDKIWKMTLAAAISAQIDYNTGRSGDTTPRDIKQVAMDETFMYITGTGPAGDWDRLKRSDNSVTYRGSGANGAIGAAIDNLTHHSWISGGAASPDWDDLSLENTDVPGTVAAQIDAGFKTYDAIFDGINCWVITEDATPAGRRYVRKYQFDPTVPTLTLKETIDIGTALDPTAMALGGDGYLYVACHGIGAANAKIIKIFIGK